jgi:hypothetical protein
MTMAEADTDRLTEAERAVERARATLGSAGAQVEGVEARLLAVLATASDGFPFRAATPAEAALCEEFCAAKDAYAGAEVNLRKAEDVLQMVPQKPFKPTTRGEARCGGDRIAHSH